MITIREEERTYRQITNIDYCCERLEEAIGDGSLHWTEDQCGIALGAVEGIPISHCPFCGELLTIHLTPTKNESVFRPAVIKPLETIKSAQFEHLQDLSQYTFNVLEEISAIAAKFHQTVLSQVQEIGEGEDERTLTEITREYLENVKLADVNNHELLSQIYLAELKRKIEKEEEKS